MSPEIVIAAAIVGLVVLIIAARTRRLGLVAGALTGFFPAYGSFLPPGLGLAVYLVVLSLIAVLAWPDRAPGVMQRCLGLLLLLGLVLLVGLREIVAGRVPPTTAMVLGAGVAIAVLLVIVGSSGRSGGFFGGFVAGGVFLAAAELLRVATGGMVHTATVVFDLNPIVLAHYLALACLVAVVRVSRGEWRLLGSLAALVCLGGVVVSGSRGPLLGLAVGCAFVIATRGGAGDWRKGLAGRLFVLGYGLALAVAALAAFGDVYVAGWLRVEDEDGNASTRIDAWTAAMRTIEDHPLAGAGIGQYADSLPGAMTGLPDYPHNVFLETWAEAGLLAVALLVIALLVILRRSGVAGAGFVLMGIVEFSLSGSLDTSVMFWTTCAFGLILGTRDPSMEVRDTRVVGFRDEVLRGARS